MVKFTNSVVGLQTSPTYCHGFGRARRDIWGGKGVGEELSSSAISRTIKSVMRFREKASGLENHGDAMSLSRAG